MLKIAPNLAAGLVFAAGSALLISESWAQTSEPPLAQATPALAICLAIAPYGLDPARGASGSASALLSRAVFDTLVSVDVDGQTTEPRLALEWDVSPDRLQYTFRLRQGVTFHETPIFEPTRRFGPADVVFTFNRLLDPAHPLAPNGAGANVSDVIASVEALDNDQVRFTLKAPNSGFLLLLARDFAAIQSAEYGEKLLAARQAWMLDTNPVGTGAFSVAKIGSGFDAVKSQGPRRKPLFEVIASSAGPVIRTLASIPVLAEKSTRNLLKSINLTANAAYWDGAPYSENLVIDAEPDIAERYGRLVRGDCQIMPGPAEADIEALTRNPDVGVTEIAGNDTIYLAFNTEKAPLDNKWVRLALSEAIDLDALGRRQGPGGSPAGALVQDAGNLIAVERRIFNTDFAKAHLADAGANLQKLRLLVPVSDPGDTAPIAESLAKAWGDLGVNVTINKILWADMGSELSKGEYDIALLAWRADSTDLAQNYQMVLSCDAIGTTNASRWCDKPFMADLKAIRDADTQADRVERTRKIAQRVATDLPIMPLLYLKQRWAVRTEIDGLDANALGAANLTRAVLRTATNMPDQTGEPDIDPESGEDVTESGG